MEKKILIDYGWCQITFEDQKYFITFDEGAAVVNMKKYEISELQMKIAIGSETNAEKIAFILQKKV
ncbi:MAG: hypothetical protein H0W50_09315 [Parachlamydiaceae bacterium]|nr:hypothetical protein [Parachlamydiaceae bacterium]